MDTLKNYGLTAIFLFVMAIGVTVLREQYLYLTDEFPITLNQEPLPPTAPAFHAGDKASFIFDYCINYSTSYNVVQKLVKVDDPAVSFLVPPIYLFLIRDREEPCKISDGNLKPIPRDAPPGHYYFELNAYAEGQRQHIIEKTYRTGEFEVLPPRAIPTQQTGSGNSSAR
ncbi:MAG TPA: hypothetical protein VGN57_18930 [Pirellulaceae bacterium]|nr:hypothetical protein [Pirellulaceae bacterium]